MLSVEAACNLAPEVVEVCAEEVRSAASRANSSAPYGLQPASSGFRRMTNKIEGTVSKRLRPAIIQAAVRHPVCRMIQEHIGFIKVPATPEAEKAIPIARDFFF